MNRIFTTAMSISILATLLSGQVVRSGDSAVGEKKSEKLETPSPSASTASNPKPRTGDDFVIGIEDLLSINVWHEAELSRTVQVRPDGKISLPLVGDVVASGLTPHDLQDKLSTDLEKFISH